MTQDELRATYPGVSTAYEFVVPSYGWMIERLEAAESRIQTLQVFAATVSFGIPGAAKVLSPDIRFADWRFEEAAVLYVIMMGIGLRYRSKGGVMLANPRIHYEQWLHFDEWEFKKTAVEWAGKHFDRNSIEIGRKFMAAVWMTGLFLVELLLLLAWVVTA